MKPTLVQFFLGALLLALLAVQSVSVYLDYRRHHKPLLETRYQKVVLQNGEAYYGRLAHLGTDHPVLRNAFRVESVQDGAGGAPVIHIRWLADSAEAGNHLIFPRESILQVQPVRDASVIGKALAVAIDKRAATVPPLRTP